MSKKKDDGKMFAYEVFMAQATKEGRVRREELSMKVLKPDLSLQARVDHINVDHVRALHEILKNGQPLAPIVVFEIAPGKFKIADGFHRHEVYKREKLPGIPCTVVAGTLQEAIEYAASANQALSLPRTREDARKAVFMLLANGWLGKPNSVIARHAGVSPATVPRQVLDYCSANGLTPPGTVTLTDGREMTRRRAHNDRPRIREEYKVDASGKQRSQFAASVGGRSIKLGSSKPEAEQRLNEFLEARSWTPSQFATVCARRGVHILPSSDGDDSTMHTIGGYRVGSIAVAASISSLQSHLLEAFAKTILVATHWALPRRIVVCETGRQATELRLLMLQAGVEVLTLDEFVAAVKADEAAQPIDDDTRAALEQAGYVFGDAEDFFGLDEEERRLVSAAVSQAKGRAS